MKERDLMLNFQFLIFNQRSRQQISKPKLEMRNKYQITIKKKETGERGNEE